MKKKIFSIVVLIIFLSACKSIGENREQRDATPEIKQYLQADICEKLTTVITYGYDKVDGGHYTLLIPEWMKTNLSGENYKQELIICSKDQYKFLVDNSEDTHRAEKIEALLFFLIEMKYRREPEVLIIFHKAICDDALTDDYALVLSYYVDIHGYPPDYSLETNEVIKQICLSAN
jgi:hypothetical protein